jgi:delta8-fatty-acid desaturase
LTVASSEEAVITDDADDSNVSEPGSVMLTSSTDSSVSSSPLIQSSTLFFTKKSLQSAIQSDSITGQRRLLVVINGKVCDLTRFASQHPGGPLVIEHMVGRDATDVFTAFHPPSVAKLISGYSIGEWVEFPGDGPIDASLSLPSLVAAKLIGADTAMHTGNAADETAEMRSKRISNNYRQFNIQLREKGFYQVNPWFYYRRFALFAVLLSLALYTIMSAPDSLLNLTIGGLVLGFVWHGLSFSVHDLAHHSGFGNSKTDHTIAIFLASFVGGLSGVYNFYLISESY